MRKISSHNRHFYGVVSVAALALTANPALAQAEPDESSVEPQTPVSSGEILVTARKRTESLSDIPETITAFTSEALEQAGIKNIDDIGRSLPNVVLNRRGDNEPNAVIRGVGGFGNTQGVGFYVDDVRNVTDQSARIVDLERVEVLKGPQGTLYGGSSIGGAIKFVTKKPNYDGVEGHVKVEAGGQNILNLEGAVNLPIAEDTAAVRISAYSDYNGGYLTNPLILDTRPDESKEYGVRGSLRINPGDNTEIVTTLRYIRMNTGGYPSYPTDGPSDFSFESPGITNGFNRKEVLGGILSIDHDFDFATLTSLSSYTRRRNQVLWDFSLTGDPDTAVVASQDDPVTTDVVTQELRLSSNGSGPFNWLAGLYYSSVEDFDLLSQVDLYFNVPVLGEPNVPDFYDTTTLQKTYAAFANVGYEAGGFEINVGARLDKSKFTGEDNSTGQTGSISKTIVLPKASVSYDLTRGTMLYASVAKGYEPGRVPVYGDGAFQPFRPETSLNYEVGVKGDMLDGMLLYELAGFHITYKDRQFETRVNEDGVIYEKIVNVGKSESYGAEFSATLRPSDALTITGTGGYLHSEWKNGIFDFEDVSGKTTPNAPKFTGTLVVDYTQPVSDNLELGLRADVMHNSGFYWDVPNVTRQDDYNLVGMRIALSDLYDTWELAARVVNLFDKRYNYEYQDQIYGERDPITGDCNLCGNARLGQPRLYTVSFAYNF